MIMTLRIVEPLKLSSLNLRLINRKLFLLFKKYTVHRNFATITFKEQQNIIQSHQHFHPLNMLVERVELISCPLGASIIDVYLEITFVLLCTQKSILRFILIDLLVIKQEY